MQNHLQDPRDSTTTPFPQQSSPKVGQTLYPIKHHAQNQEKIKNILCLETLAISGLHRFPQATPKNSFQKGVDSSGGSRYIDKCAANKTRPEPRKKNSLRADKKVPR
ncbi:hypothetical protein [Spirulina major]|uniref:hypothetical protein n=1 Tax=Spirulina major TaxID=270636 RepID=UPI001114ED0B|nr:hypothetical protein [Spirulina major]